ncbi:acyltransferase family protein [Rhodoblastus sp.]|uniref:acyltransferase family protein n=1 Tax=Rhodoblastus sp. TaxID=1962975 RepID=UPI0025EE8488|nr:acyltransferase family protein [Rhodoblastus sp.]
MQLKYRSDIDGLRAIAVVAVVIFHVAQSVLRGGFVGVDVFFVISGYLISLGIVDGVANGTFTLGRFYTNRARRIAPAYLVLLVIVTCVVVAVAFPAETSNFGAALIAAIFSVSNIYFWMTTNYFSVAAEELPLLHTWSLSVEEQFYFFFPLLLQFTLKRGRRTTLIALTSLFVASLASSAVLVHIWPIGTFYSLPTRAWELLLGSLLALEYRWRDSHSFRPSGALVSAIGGAGLLAMAYAIYFYDSTMPFPGLAAALPCLGAGAVLYSGSVQTTPVSRMLSVAPMRFVGKISYSLYLWHWPILVIQKIAPFIPGSESKVVARGGVIVLSFVAAALSWRFIEQPTRNRSFVPPRLLVRSVVAGAGALCLGGLVLTATAGLPNRYAPDVLAVTRYLDYDQVPQFRVGTCFLTREHGFADFDARSCLPALPGKPNILVVGDSHAAALAHGLRDVFSGANILQISGVGCPPLVVTQPDSPAYCAKLLDLAFRSLPDERKLSAVWLVGRWNLGRVGAAPGWRVEWLDDLRDTIANLRARGLPVVLIGPMPEYSTELPRLIAREMQTGGKATPAASLTASSLRLDEIMEAFAREQGVSYVSLRNALCPDGVCTTRADGAPLQFDTDHLSDRGSDYLAARIRSQLAAFSPDLNRAVALPAVESRATP